MGNIFDNGGFIGRVADYTATDFYTQTGETSGETSGYPEPDTTPTFTQAATSDSAALDRYAGRSALFVADLVFPSSPSDGLIWETGGTGLGAWFGIRDSGVTMRLRGGDGASSKTASTVDTAVVDITDFPKDGLTHQVMWDFNDATGTARIFIDGILKGESSATRGSFDGGQYAGSNNMAYLQNSTTAVTVGETTTASNFIEAGTGLRYYDSQVAQFGTITSEVTGNKKNSGVWSLNTVWQNAVVTPTYSDPSLANPSTATILTTIPYSGSMLVSGNHLLIGADSTLKIYDISDLNNITETSSTTNTTAFSLIRGIAIKENVAYIYGGDRLSSVDISNKSSPIVIDTLVNSTILNSGQAIKIQGNYAYTVSTNRYFASIDISDPNNLVLVDSIFDSELHVSCDLVIDGDYAYISAFEGYSLNIFNISNPLNITKVTTYETANTNHGRGVVKVGDYLYYSSSFGFELVTINVSNPSTPTTAAVTSSGYISYMVTDGSYIYAACTYNSNRFEVYSIINPTAPTLVNTITGIPGANFSANFVTGREGVIFVSSSDGTTKVIT
jgi:hypothetical protein